MRAEQFDKRLFTDRVAELCDSCAVDFYSAHQDPGTQAEQLATAIAAGPGVIVLDAIDPFSVTTLMSSAQEVGIKVVGYNALLDGLDYYVGFDHAAGGTLQAHALLRATRGRGNLVMLNGSPVDPAAVQAKQAAHVVLDASLATVVGEYDALDGKERATRTWFDNLLAFYPPDQIQGVNAGSDDLAGLAIRALVDAGADRSDLPPVTGYGAQLAGIRRIIAGQQLMTVYEPIRSATDRTAEVAVAALQGEDPGPATDLDGVAAFLLTPVPVTKDRVEDTVVADGYWSVAMICTPPYASACKRVGLR
jgi:D-xylose transport system substrate-binding protein